MSSPGGERPEVGGLVHPDDKRVPVGDENPLADVELGVVDQQRALYVLLHHVPGPSVLKFRGIIYKIQVERPDSVSLPMQYLLVSI